jgi:hypothetical protein
MITFIIPLQSKSASKNWELVCSLFKRTLNSVLSQTCDNYKVIIVCEDLPDNLPEHKNLIVIKNKFQEGDLSVSRNRMQNKWDKVRFGLQHVQCFLPCYVMIVDADDLVSNRIAEFCNNNSNKNGWYLNNGWLHDEGSNQLYLRRRDFNMMCGTSSIVYLHHDDLTSTNSHDEQSCIILKCGHTTIKQGMIKRGTPLSQLPFIGSVYILGTGENDSGFSLKSWDSIKVRIKKLLSYRYLSKKIRNEFSLFELTKS